MLTWRKGKHFSRRFDALYSQAFRRNKGFTTAELSFLDLENSTAGGGRWDDVTFTLETQPADYGIIMIGGSPKKRYDWREKVDKGMR